MGNNGKCFTLLICYAWISQSFSQVPHFMSFMPNMPSETEHLEPSMPSLPPEIEPTKASISDLPLELMDEIIQLLPIKCQVCFALSCKSLYVRYQNVLAQEEFAFPTYNSDGGWLPCGVLAKNSSRETNLRRQLLCRLQGPRRLYCCSCTKLHLANEFESSEREYSTGINRKCKYPGFVNVCPCSPLDIRAMARMLEGCQHECIEWHRCSVTIAPEVVADVRIYISQDEQTYLRVRSQWEIAYTKEWFDYPNIARFLGCPHRSIVPNSPVSRLWYGQLDECFACSLYRKGHWNEIGKKFESEITRTLDAREILRSEVDAKHSMHCS